MADQSERVCLFCERCESSGVQMFMRDDNPAACICNYCVMNFTQLYVALIRRKVDDQALKKRMKILLTFVRRLGGDPPNLLEFCSKAVMEAHLIASTKDDEASSINLELPNPSA